MSTVAQNPIQTLRDVSSAISSCDPSTGNNCSCTDPSYIYTNPCKIGSRSQGTNTRTKCYYGSIPTGSSGPESSVSSSLASKASLRLSVKPGTGDRQFFTSTNNNSPSVSGSQPIYPASLLFCADPTGLGGTTLSTPNLSYSTTNNAFTNWDSSTKNNQSFNLGFD